VNRRIERRGTSIAAAVVWILSLTQCTDDRSVPSPQLDRVEPAVAAKLNRCRAAVVADPSGANWLKYGRTLHAHEMLAEAEQAYVAAAAVLDAGDPTVFEALHLAGCATMEWNPRNAVEHFTRALALRDDFATTHLNAGVVNERLGRFAVAKAHYEHVISRWRSSHANLGLGRIAMLAGDTATALTYFDAALTINPELRAVHEAMARAYARLGKREESRTAARRAGDLEMPTTVLDPLFLQVIAERVDVGSRIARGIRLARSNRDAEAIAELEAAVAAMPRHAEARFVLASILHKAGRKDDARAQLDTLLSREKPHKRALELRARILVEGGRREAARADLEAILAIDPAHAWARAELGK
jgi:tetratricopeptide (TPR) repeat protein